MPGAVYNCLQVRLWPVGQQFEASVLKTEQVSTMHMFFKLQKITISGELQLSNSACWEVY